MATNLFSTLADNIMSAVAFGKRVEKTLSTGNKWNLVDPDVLARNYTEKVVINTDTGQKMNGHQYIKNDPLNPSDIRNFVVSQDGLYLGGTYRSGGPIKSTTKSTNQITVPTLSQNQMILIAGVILAGIVIFWGSKK